ncbi:Sterol-4-alpha-carboxylate 3-dehydrogenase [Lachnellula suecica]|uniref:Sterol-4-alpha-carboxylate 3-dehydrogenase n=1 Tax=Lachnellula suecica TaxID=602035 RepID=A0A8T9CKP9_9HELO|nr:Sterol-4-alpha-carboxylate 3-dehydrogenase [Lachnellula suecica]
MYDEHLIDVVDVGDVPEIKNEAAVAAEEPIFGACLVVGGCGFLGSHVVDFLLAEPTVTSVAVMSRFPFKNRSTNPKVTYHIGDITLPHQVRHVVSQVKPRVIINTASPHAYIDHEHALDNFYVNVDGNRNLLEAAADVGTVKAFVYTSSGPIVASRGGGYSLADESKETLANKPNGDPYHIAKALGDKMTLEANGKKVRPTALYGERDFQFVEPVIRALEDGQTNIWMGYDDIDMDVVYVGHVAEVEVKAARGLLRRHFDSSGPKIDGEAFNVTDDEPCHPWTFFRKYWILAGDETPLSSIWMIPPLFVMLMAHTAEWITWATSWGKLRPQMLKVERMEFVLLTRTYNISKVRNILGFEPWKGQPHASQEAAIKASIDWYLSPEIHGPAKLPGKSSIPETPFRLISQTGAKTKTGLPLTHYCIRNAQIMAMTHNTIFRAVNSIYYQALKIAPGSQDAVDFLTYCSIVFEFMHHHHVIEELHYFPALQKHTGNSGPMEENIQQHRDMEEGLDKLRKYAETVQRNKYDGATLRELIDELAPKYQAHMDAEISTILDLHNMITSEDLKKIDKNMRNEAEKYSDIFKAAPLYLGCQDKNFTVDDAKIPFPEVSLLAAYFVDWVLSSRHQGAWRFNPSDMYGSPRKPYTAKPIAPKKELELLTDWNRPAESLIQQKLYITILSVLVVYLAIHFFS